jgi:hypothetical protein
VVLLFSSDREEGPAERGSSIPVMSRAHGTKAGFSSMMAMSTTTKRKRRRALVLMELIGNNKSGSAVRSQRRRCYTFRRRGKRCCCWLMERATWHRDGAPLLGEMESERGSA